MDFKVNLERVSSCETDSLLATLQPAYQGKNTSTGALLGQAGWAGPGPGSRGEGEELLPPGEEGALWMCCVTTVRTGARVAVGLQTDQLVSMGADKCARVRSAWPVDI